MNTAANVNRANISRPNHSYTVFSEARLMQTIGEDLRTIYGELVDHSAPADLLRLASLIDEKRQAGDLAE